MDYEKKYKDALSHAKQAYGTGAYDDSTLEAIFPELAESEDEKMIKAITHILYENYTDAAVIEGVEIAEIVAWLERHKEQKPSHRFLPGDWAVYDGPLGHAILQVKDVVDGRYTFVDNDSTLLEEDSDKFLRPLTTKDVEKPTEWSEEDEETIGTLINYFEGDALDYSADEMIRRIRALRPSWKPNDEEEVRLINTSISFLKDFADKGYENAVECIDWLKSKLNGNTCE